MSGLHKGIPYICNNAYIVLLCPHVCISIKTIVIPFFAYTHTSLSSDCADAQTDVNLCYSHALVNTFSLGATNVMFKLLLRAIAVLHFPIYALKSCPAPAALAAGAGHYFSLTAYNLTFKPPYCGKGLKKDIS